MQPPNDPPASRQRWVSFDQARMILRMSEGTLRREIRAGRVTAEQRRRNPDSPTDLRMVYEVLVTDPPLADASSESVQAPTIRQEPPAPAVDVQAVVDAATAPLTEMLALERAERQRLANELRTEAAGRAAAEARAALFEAERDEARRERDRERNRSWWERLWGIYPQTES